jgi:hypothetical protein
MDFGNLDRFVVYGFSIFHGIVTAYFVFLLTGADIGEAYFLILVLFCCFLNMVVMRAITIVLIVISGAFLRLKRKFSSDKTGAKASALVHSSNNNLRAALAFAPQDLLKPPSAVYFVGCLLVSFLSAYALASGYQYDWILKSYARLVYWPKDQDRNPLEQFLVGSCSSDPTRVCSEKEFEYMRIWWSNTEIITAGFISSSPSRRQDQVVQLSNTCQLVLDKSDKTEIHKLNKGAALTSFVDLSNPNILFIEVDRGIDPCASEELVPAAPFVDGPVPVNLP